MHVLHIQCLAQNEKYWLSTKEYKHSHRILVVHHF